MTSTLLHGRLLALLACSLLIVGCATPNGATIDAASAEGLPSAAWNLTAEVSLGYIAAAGIQSPDGDFVVGLTSEEQCPEARFIVPQGTNSVSAVVVSEATPNPHKIALSSPNSTTYQDVIPPDEFSHIESNPIPGLWGVRIYPMGASTNSRWTATVTVAGTGTAPDVLDIQTEISCRV